MNRLLLAIGRRLFAKVERRYHAARFAELVAQSADYGSCNGDELRETLQVLGRPERQFHAAIRHRQLDNLRNSGAERRA